MMKRVALLLCLIPGLAFANNWCDDLYGGFRVGGRNMGFKSNYGDKLFSKNLVQYSIFGGMQFTKNFGAELSLFTTNNKKRTANVENRQLGSNFTVIRNSDSYNTETKLSGVSLQATARTSIYKCVDVYGSAGIGYGRLKLKSELVSRNGATPSATARNASSFDAKSSKFYPVIGVGLDWRIVKNFGVRTDIGYEYTQVFKNIAYADVDGNRLKANGSFIYGLSAYLAI